MDMGGGMEVDDKKVTLIKSALFVDFDNIFIGLSKSDPLAAERFASDPARWLTWLEKGLPNRQRSILVRRCYPNPDAGFRRFRSFFTSAAFTVVDCPSLTHTGKNSSDIYMVMDILDILNHKTHFDEFIIFSGDSDFMPVLLRLRAHDRRTTTLGIDFMPPAYIAACDLVISEEDFIEEALGVTHENGIGLHAARAQVPVPLLHEMASRLYQAALQDSEVAGADLPDILKDFREFRESTNWLGFGTSQRLAEALTNCDPRLDLVRLSPTMYKMVLNEPVEVEAQVEETYRPGKTEKGSRSVDRQAVAEPLPDSVERHARVDLNRLRAQILFMVKDIIAGSAVPILLARVSQIVVNQLGPQVLESQWAGAGSFKRLLQSAEAADFKVTTLPEPGYIFDPKRHLHPAQGRPIESEASTLNGAFVKQPEETTGGGTFDGDDMERQVYGEALPSLEEFIRRVSRVTGAPDLSSAQYAMAFRGIIVELQQVANGEKTYNTYQSSKTISDWCGQHGAPISRDNLVLILKGIIFQDGERFSTQPGSYNERDLAQVVLKNIKALCRRARLELSNDELRLLEDWIVGGLDETAAVDGREPILVD